MLPRSVCAIYIYKIRLVTFFLIKGTLWLGKFWWCGITWIIRFLRDAGVWTNDTPIPTIWFSLESMYCCQAEMGPDPTGAYFWPKVNKRPTRLWPGYFLTRPEEIFLTPREKNWKIWHFYGKFSKFKPKPFWLTRPNLTLATKNWPDPSIARTRFLVQLLSRVYQSKLHSFTQQVMFNSIGERLNNLSSIVINKVRKTLKAKQTEATEMDLICVVSTLSAIVATTGAAAFSQYEGNTKRLLLLHIHCGKIKGNRSRIRYHEGDRLMGIVTVFITAITAKVKNLLILIALEISFSMNKSMQQTFWDDKSSYGLSPEGQR